MSLTPVSQVNYRNFCPKQSNFSIPLPVDLRLHMDRQQMKTLEISSRRAGFFLNFEKKSRINRDRRPRVPASNINPKTKQLHRKERLIQPCVLSGGGTLCVLRQIDSKDFKYKITNTNPPPGEQRCLKTSLNIVDGEEKANPDVDEIGVYETYTLVCADNFYLGKGDKFTNLHTCF